MFVSLLLLGKGEVCEELVLDGGGRSGVGLDALLVKDLGGVNSKGDVHAGYL